MTTYYGGNVRDLLAADADGEKNARESAMRKLIHEHEQILVCTIIIIIITKGGAHDCNCWMGLDGGFYLSPYRTNHDVQWFSAF